MMKTNLNGTQLPALLLRLGLATVFLYAAIASFANPQEWLGYLPGILTTHFDGSMLLKFFSAYEIVLAALLISGLYIRSVALLAALTLGGIVFTNFRNFFVTFRDIGLILAALALAALKQK